MSDFEDYYHGTHKTGANSNTFECFEQDFDVFPREGIYIGELESVCGLKAPALIPLDQTNGVCFLSTPDNEVLIKKTMQMMALRLALTIPPGLCKFTLYDAKRRGQDLVFLSELDSKIIGEKILTKPNELKDALVSINKSIETTIQKVLGFRYANKDLAEYNKEAGDLAQAYQILILTDVPYSLSKEIGEILLEIVNTGRKAGVFTIINFDTTYSSGKEFEFNPMPLLDIMTTIYEKNGRFYVKNYPDKSGEELWHRFALHLETEIPDADKIEEVEQYINKRLSDSQSKPIYLSDKFTQGNFWKGKSGDGIIVPIGMVGPGKMQELRLSVEDGGQADYHCLIGGTTGSGKSVLLHNIICNTAWLYSPNEVQFILLDFKEGTEFMVYKDLPHVKALSIKSETEFAIKVLEFLDAERKRRAELFQSLTTKENKISNLASYNEVAKQKLPRLILVIDECQKLFDSPLGEKISFLISQVGEQGRSFGFNMILSTLNLGANVGKALNQCTLRISMRLTKEEECNRVLGQGNLMPMTLTKKGESVYCSGGIKANSVKYRVAKLDDSKIVEMIGNMHKAYENWKDENVPFSRYIFDGVSPAEISTNAKIKAGLSPSYGEIKIYVGTPFALRDEHSYYALRKENGHNVLIIGQDLGSATSIIYYSIQQIVEQSGQTSKFVVCDKCYQGNSYFGKLGKLASKYPNVKVVTEDADIEHYIIGLCVELDKRKTEKGEYPRMVMAFNNLYNYSPIRMQFDITTSISKKFMELLKNGPQYGIHIIAHVDTYQHYCECFSRAMSEWRTKIELRGGSGFQFFGNSRMFKTTVNNSFTACIKTADMDDEQIEKIKVYNI